MNRGERLSLAWSRCGYRRRRLAVVLRGRIASAPGNLPVQFLERRDIGAGLQRADGGRAGDAGVHNRATDERRGKDGQERQIV